MLRVYMPTLGEPAFRAFGRALTLAEQIGAGAAATDGLQEASGKAWTQASALMSVAPAQGQGAAAPPIPVANLVAYEIGAAATAAAQAAEAATRQADAASAESAFAAYLHADNAARSAGAGGMAGVMHRDFEILRQAADRGVITDETPVSPDFAGFGAELRTYQRELAKLLPHEGKFVAIRGEQVLGPLETYGDAVEAGYERFGLEPFLVKRVETRETVLQFPATPTTPCPT
jgi:hypothetical protein